MRSFAFLSEVLLIFAVPVSAFIASPLDTRHIEILSADLLGPRAADPVIAAPLQARDIECDPIGRYTVDWFLDNFVYDPPESTCLFYGSGQSDAARRFASNSRRALTTIWDIWPRRQYRWSLNSTKPDPYNPMRCIFNNETLRTQYFVGMSTAMGALCSGTAFFMTPDPNPSNIPRAGLFWTDERPEMLLNRRRMDRVVYDIYAIPTGRAEPRFRIPNTRVKKREDEIWAELSYNTTQYYSMHNWLRRANPDPDAGADAGAEIAFDVCGPYPVEW